MSAPVCIVMDAAAVARMSDGFMHLWLLTIVGLLLMRVDLWALEDRVRRFLRRRRIQRIRAARMVSHG